MIDAKDYLGRRCKDAVTGYTGICISIAHYLNGCDRVIICGQELTKDGTPNSHDFGFDFDRIEWLPGPDFVSMANKYIGRSTLPPGGPSDQVDSGVAVSRD